MENDDKEFLKYYDLNTPFTPANLDSALKSTFLDMLSKNAFGHFKPVYLIDKETNQVVMGIENNHQYYCMRYALLKLRCTDKYVYRYGTDGKDLPIDEWGKSSVELDEDDNGIVLDETKELVLQIWRDRQLKKLEELKKLSPEERERRREQLREQRTPADIA